MTNADKYLKDGVSEYDFLDFVFSKGNVGWNGKEDYCFIKKLDLLHLLQQPLKPTLSEDEKVILKNINTDIYAKIGRHKCGEIIFRNVNDSYVVITPYFKFENMFQFIKPRRRI